MAYDWWAICVTVLGIVGYAIFNDMPGFNFRLVPTWKDLVIATAALLLLGAPIIPLGILSGFLKWSSFTFPNPLDVSPPFWPYTARLQCLTG